MAKGTVEEKVAVIAKRRRDLLDAGFKKMAPKTIGEAVLWIARRGEPICFERLLDVLRDPDISLDDVPSAWRPVAIDVLLDAKTASPSTSKQTP